MTRETGETTEMTVTTAIANEVTGCTKDDDEDKVRQSKTRGGR